MPGPLMKVNNILTYEVGEIGGLMRSAWSWWITETTSMLPRSVRERLVRHRRYFVADFGGETIAARCLLQAPPFGIILPEEASRSINQFPPDGRDLRQADKELDGTIICLQSTEVARKKLRYPRTSAKNLRQMIELDLPKLSPLNPGMVYFGFRQERAESSDDGGRRWSNVEVWIARCDVIEKALALCHRLELTPVAIVTPDSLAAGSIVDNILPKQQTKLREWLWRARNPALIGLAFALAVGISLAAKVRQADLDSRLESELKRKRTAVQAIENDRAELQRLERRKDFLARQQQHPQPGAVIAGLARVLPDDVWVYNLEYGKNELRIRGFAPRANELIPALDASGLLSAAQFRSPIVLAPGGGIDRFDIAASVKGSR